MIIGFRITETHPLNAPLPTLFNFNWTQREKILVAVLRCKQKAEFPHALFMITQKESNLKRPSVQHRTYSQ